MCMKFKFIVRILREYYYLAYCYYDKFSFHVFLISLLQYSIYLSFLKKFLKNF